MRHCTSHEVIKTWLIYNQEKRTWYESVHLFLLLTDADFVSSALVRESLGSSIGDDDKIYFFFTEGNQEQTASSSHSRVARVARVCKVRADQKETPGVFYSWE